MRLFIAEKPSLAKAIAAELGVTSKGNGFIECGNDTVTWCFGHMFEFAEPDAYTPADVPLSSSGSKVWRTDELPIIPEDWILTPKEDAEKQLAVIGRLIKKSSEIVNAGDPDREGQLLVDDVLNHFKSSKPVKRILISAMDSVSVRRGLDSLKDNSDYAGWADSARARSMADWLIGMNLSRAYTLRAQRGGSRVLMTVGRVQTPTLALVVARDLQIEAFKPIPYHTIHAAITHQEGKFLATWKAQEDQAGLDSEGRLVDPAVAAELISKVKGQAGKVKEYKPVAKKQNQPLAFSLSDITVMASSKFGYSSDLTLKTCQSLYETHALTSYPRTDCAYLPESQHADAEATLEALKHVNPDLASLIEKADPRIKSKTWSDAKITGPHHGIVPTMHKGDKTKLNEAERNIYDLIVRAYLAQFYPLHEYTQTAIELDIAGEMFAARGKTITKNGWRDVYLVEDEDEGEKEKDNAQSLPKLAKGDDVDCIGAVKKDAKTKPPSRFTDGTLTRAMENIHRFVDSPEHKKILRDGDGIGTPATRASIMQELHRREFLEHQGSRIVSTKLGRSVIAALPEVVRSPVLTALYERMLKEIEENKADLKTFIERQEKFIREQVAQANNGAITIEGGKPAIAVSSIHKCKECGSGLSRRPTKKKGVFWWGCSNYPTCTQTYPDIKGSPNYEKAAAKK